MKLSARVLSFVLRKSRQNIGKLFIFFLAFTSLVGLITPLAFADESSTNADVPNNQHTSAQTALIEVSAALICQLAGVDIIDPHKGCLGVDTTTKKIGYAPQGTSDLHVGGLLGMSTNMFSTVYEPPASGVAYVASLRNDFGIVKNTYAQDVPQGERTGFDALTPVRGLWETARNLTYLLLVVVFVIIGVAIMLRVKIDPRTSMSIQNQIPKIIVTILMITFSYAIVGFFIDVMWTITYVTINGITAAAPNVQNCESNENLQEGAYLNLLNFPLVFTNDLFKGPVISGPDSCEQGVVSLSNQVGSSIGSIADVLVSSIVNSGQRGCVEGLSVDPGACVDAVLGSLINWIGRVFGFLIAVVAIIAVMFRLWWQLLKAYAYVVIYTVVGPFYILLGLLPNSTLGWNGWIRTIAAKLLAFPGAVAFILLARVILEAYRGGTTDPSTHFVPPLVGNPNMNVYGPLVAFAVLLISPEVLNMLNDALKAPANKYTGPAVMKGIGGGIAPFAAGAGVATGMFFRKANHAAGIDMGVGRKWLMGTPIDPTVVGERPTPRQRFSDIRSRIFRPLLGESGGGGHH